MLLTGYSSFSDIEKDTKKTDYLNWYALQTMSGYEKGLFSKLQVLYGDFFRIYLPQREVIHKIKGMEHKIQIPLFPGYLFVHEKIDDLMMALDVCSVEKYSKPVSADGKYLKVCEQEMMLLFGMGGEDGVITISKGVVKPNSQVKIISGPLKNFSGKILFVNKRKKKAKVRIEMMNRVVDVSLGLELVYEC